MVLVVDRDTAAGRVRSFLAAMKRYHGELFLVSQMVRTKSLGRCGYGSFISNAEVCGKTRSPSPRPSPRGEGEASPDPRTLPGHTSRRPMGDDPPSPCLPSRSVLAKAGG